MCEYFVEADPILYESRSRTVRIHGVLTSIRLEKMMGRAGRNGCGGGRTTRNLITHFHNEIMARRNEILNFASSVPATWVCGRFPQAEKTGRGATPSSRQQIANARR
jgi:predicted DNA-binding ribbon-helix-helix protein